MTDNKDKSKTQYTSHVFVSASSKEAVDRLLSSADLDPGDVLELHERVSTESGDYINTTIISPKVFRSVIAHNVGHYQTFLISHHGAPGDLPTGTSFSYVKRFELSPRPQLKVGKLLLYLFLDRENIDAELGDLDELYHKADRDIGRFGATIVYYRHVQKSIWPQLRRSIVRWGLFGWAADLVRRISS